jgi:hypothetical protein
MGGFPSIVVVQASLEIRGNADITLIDLRFALQ